MLTAGQLLRWGPRHPGRQSYGFRRDVCSSCSSAYAVAAAMDEGYIKCTVHYRVWHGEENTYESDDGIEGILEIESRSEGDGLIYTDFNRSYEQPGYEDGKVVCDDMFTTYRAAAQYHRDQWNAVAGDGNAVLSLTLTALQGLHPGQLLSNQLHEVHPEAGIAYDQNSGILAVGCQSAGCPLSIGVILENDCGAQTLTPTSEGARYTYEGPAGCTTLTIVIHGYEIEVTAPLSISQVTEATGPRYGGEE